jgi:predicted nucleic acid-binding Zn ribbon protein
VPPAPPTSPKSSAARVRKARRRVLAEWRRVDTSEIERAWASSARSVAAVLPRVLQDLRLDNKQHESQIVVLWRQIVDARVAAHAQPVGLVKGTLFVSVDSSVWLDEIVRYQRKEILERVQHALGREMVRRISFRVG